MNSIAILGLVGTALCIAFFGVLLAGSRSFGRRLGRHVATDVVVCCRLTAQTIIRRAARRLPESERYRYEQEWLAELDELQENYRDEPAFSLVVFALRILVRARTTGKVWAGQRSTPTVDGTLRNSEPREALTTKLSSYVSEYLGLVTTFVLSVSTWTTRIVSSAVSAVRDGLGFYLALAAAIGGIVLVVSNRQRGSATS